MTTLTQGRPQVSAAARAIKFAIASCTTTLRRGMFLFFTVALPVVMFLMFNGIYGSDDGGAAGAGIMVSMAAYGGLGAAVNCGAMIQLERSSGWLRQLMVAGLGPRAFVFGKMVAAAAVLLPALVGVSLVGLLVGVPVSIGHAAAAVLVLWVALLPMILLGLVVGLALKPSAVQGAATVVMMALAVAGGLWFPVSVFPGWLATLSKGTPSRWIGELGRWAALDGDLPGLALPVLLGWTVALLVIASWLFRRAAEGSRR